MKSIDFNVFGGFSPIFGPTSLRIRQGFLKILIFPKIPNFEIKISRRLLNGFQNFWMIMKGEITLFLENRVRAFGEVSFDIFGWGKDSVFSENPLSQLQY